MSRRTNRKKPLNRATPLYLANTGGLMYVPPGQAQGVQGQTFYGSSAKNIATGQQALFSPGTPLAPQPGVNIGGYPIQYRFPIASNTFPIDRTSNSPDIPSFQQLRNLAKLYNGVGLCERAWFDMVPRMQLKIGLKPEYIAGGADEKDYQPEISYFKTWFESPDKMHDLHSWIRMALREQTQIDELYIYKRKKRGGGLYSMEIIAGDQFKPLLDDWGRTPQPPSFSCQQYPWGLPGAWFRSDEMIHYQESPAADNPYGQSRIERVILLVNQALRKQNKDLKHFTEGNVPQGMMLVPKDANWTPDQIDTFEQAWNSLLAGNASQQVRMRFTQPGMDYKAFEDYKLDPTFDKFILNTMVSSYGMSMQDVAFTEDIHKSSGDSQQNMTYRRTIDPLAVIYAGFLTSAINNDFDPDLHGEMFEASFGGYDEEEDITSLATAYTTLTGAGILGITSASKLLKLPDDINAPYIGRVVMTAAGPIFLDDMASDKMRNAQMQSQLAGFQQAATAPQKAKHAPQETDEEEPAQEPTTTQAKQSTNAPKQRTVIADQEDEIEEDEDEEGILPDEDEEDEEPTPEEIQQEDEISFHLTADTEEPYSELERYYAEAYIPDEMELLERHMPGGHDHDQKTHGDFSHPAYGAKHDTTPAAKAAMAATVKATPQLASAQAKVTSAIAKVKAAQATLHSAAKADKPAARTALKQAHADLKQARASVHTLNEQAKAQRKQLATQAHAAKVEASAKAKAEKAKTTEQEKEVKVQAKEKTQETAAHAKAAKAQAKAKAQKAAAQKKTAIAQAKAQAAKAHIQKQATAAKAKTTRMAVAAQAKAQTAAVKAAKSHAQSSASNSQGKTSSAQAHAQLKAAKSQQQAAKKLQTLTNTIGAKANLYNALSGRKISKTWTAQDGLNAAKIATDLHSLLQAVNSHQNEENVAALAKHLAQAISTLSSQKGISLASASVLQKLSAQAQGQLSRSVFSDEEEFYNDNEDEIDEDSEEEEEEELSDDEVDKGPTEEERRYTISELLQLIQQQMQTKATSQEDGEDSTRSEERGMVTTTNRQPTTDERAISAEYRRWKERSIDDIKANRGQRGFTTTLIPQSIHRWISDELATCSSVEDVRDIFSQARAMSTQQDEPTMTGKNDLAKSVHSVFQQVAQRGHKAVVALEGE